MGSDWIYHTDIKPQKNDKTLYKKELDESFNVLLNMCKIPNNELLKDINSKGFYEIILNTDNDVINSKSRYPVKFLKSKFLKNILLKKSLIDYYNPLGYFVLGPNYIGNNNWSIKIIIKRKIHF